MGHNKVCKILKTPVNHNEPMIMNRCVPHHGIYLLTLDRKVYSLAPKYHCQLNNPSSVSSNAVFLLSSLNQQLCPPEKYRSKKGIFCNQKQNIYRLLIPICSISNVNLFQTMSGHRPLQPNNYVRLVNYPHGKGIGRPLHSQYVCNLL